MLPKRLLTTKTPNTLVLGIACNGPKTAITAVMALDNESIETDVIEMVGDDLWQTITEALDDLRIVRAKHLLLLTTSKEFHGFLQKPIYVEQPQVKTVRVGREVFTARVGGNEYQWKLLRQLFCYVWRCESVDKLSKAEGLLNAS